MSSLDRLSWEITFLPFFKRRKKTFFWGGNLGIILAGAVASLLGFSANGMKGWNVVNILREPVCIQYISTQLRIQVLSIPMKKIPRIISKVYQVDMHTSFPFKNICKGISKPNYITFVNSDILDKNGRNKHWYFDNVVLAKSLTFSANPDNRLSYGNEVEQGNYS